MHKYLIFLLSLMLIIITSCSPEIVNTLPETEIKQDSSFVNVFNAKNGNGITIEFGLVSYANYYGYSINNTEIIPLQNLIFKNGQYTANINEQEKNGNIIIFAKKSTKDSWTRVAQSEFTLSLKDTEPQAYIAKRGDTFVDIKVESKLPQGSVKYKTLINGIEKTYYPTTYGFTIDNIGSDACTVQIAHALIQDTEFSDYKDINIPAYNSNITSSLTLEIKNGYFIISDIPAEFDKVNLAKYTNSIDTIENLAIIDNISEGTARLAISELASLESGYFFAYITVDSEIKLISNVEKFTVPITIKSITSNWKSIELEIDLATDLQGKVKFELKGILNTEFTITPKGILISGLDSNTDYKQLELLAYSDLFNTSCTFSVKTNSFAGIYEWKGTLKNNSKTKTTNFKVLAELAPEGSSSQYYVFFHDEDEAVAGTENVGAKLRIMPLVDPEIDNVPMLTKDSIVKVKDPLNYEKQNASYTANGKKWNSLGSIPMFTPVSWTISDWESKHDYSKTITLSTISNDSAPTLPTTTIFSFEEKKIDGKIEPVIMFTNISDNSLVKSGLYMNGSQNTDLQESDYVFCLQNVKEE